MLITKSFMKKLAKLAISEASWTSVWMQSKSLSPDLPVGCTVTEGAVERGGLGGGPGGLVAGVLRGPGLVLSVRGHGAQTSQTDWEPVISSWSSGLSVKITLGFKI